MTSIATDAPPTAAPQTAPTRAARPGLLGRGFTTLLATEAKVWLRDSSIFWVAFPTLILLVNMLMAPELREVAQGYGWQDAQGHPIYGSAVILALIPGFIAMGMGMTTLAILPATFGGFREKGVLTLFSASPMRPQALFAAHALINVAASLLGAVVMVAVAAAMTPIAMPQNLALTLVGILLGLAALLAIGSLVAAVVPKTNVGTIVGNTLFFIFLFVSGAMGGSAAPGDLLYEIARATPMGAAAQIMQYGWIGGETFPWIQMVVLAAWTLVCAPLAVKLFRWR
ncbi:ABC transporter permease [Xylanimonas ulmi]|uniref:ABC-2 type transport system permease protein n=1 Tax=Xylanimonas ulmi TaxID=228973 RepID=A0A4Q7M6X2_9MICO|nr:ABC transporter permease [Xylanibacterium ulmi]RZS62827.1 ABC-2 type transport system permease protein [Xylanibacterium ulmi]